MKEESLLLLSDLQKLINQVVLIDYIIIILGGEDMQIVENTETRAVPIGEKFMLTIKEAAPYYNIGQKKLRRMAEDNLGVFSVYSGNRYLIIRPKFEEFILNSSEI